MSLAADILKKHAVAAALELGEAFIFPALQEAVAKSENKIDDAVLMALEAPLKKAFADLIAKI